MEPEIKRYTNTTPQVLRFALDNADYVVGPGEAFTAPATPYTEGLVGKGLATSEAAPAAPSVELGQDMKTADPNEAAGKPAPCPCQDSDGKSETAPEESTETEEERKKREEQEAAAGADTNPEAVATPEDTANDPAPAIKPGAKKG